MAATARRSREIIPIHVDQPVGYGNSTEDEPMSESRDPLDESNGTVSGDEEEEVDENVAEDIRRFEASFKNITQRYRLINRIGEGTFSTVYKAEDLLYDAYKNEWDIEAEKENYDADTGLRKPWTKSKGPKFVAIKKIYVTSSPLRILNELELLYDLRNSDNVCPLITSFRHQDQVIAVLPFFQHRDFRDYYRDFTVMDMRTYLCSLFIALRSVHERGIIHRDIKPTNFLYSPAHRRGVLVDFGLAEREGQDDHYCACSLETHKRNEKINTSVYASTLTAARAAGVELRPSYPANDTRSSRRANRAGTRGFRAPEVLLKCTMQRTVIDVWSCGVILLTFLSKRFPFFHSADDIDAFLELATIFGKKKMRETALLHGQVMQTNIPTLSEGGHSWEKILLWCLGRSKRGVDGQGGLSREELDAVDFMRLCLELDPRVRVTAEEALQHEFLQGAEVSSGVSDDEE